MALYLQRRMFMSLDQLKRDSRQIYVENKRFPEIWKSKLKIMQTVFIIAVVLPPRKNTQNESGVFNCYQKN